MARIRLPQYRRLSNYQRWLLRHRGILLWTLLLWTAGLMGVGLLALPGRPLHAQEIVADATPDDAPDDTPDDIVQVQVSPYLRAQLDDGLGNDGAEVPILILMKDQPDMASLEAAALTASNNSATAAAMTASAQRIERANYIYQALASYALQSQADLRAWLDAQGIPYRAHYIINMIRVTGDAELVETLRQRTDIARLDADPQVDAMQEAGTAATVAGHWARMAQLPAMVTVPNTPANLNVPNSPDVTDGIAASHVPEVWAMGYTGQGITVASQDTGVQWDHPALRSHYRGVNGETVDHNYNWLDAISDSGVNVCNGIDTPCDDNGHGTHTVGTMVGTSEVISYGVAPDAQWIGCRNMRGGIGSPDTYTTCFEFFLAPYPQGGDPFTDGRVDLAPNVINNSWGCPLSEGCNKESLRQIVETMRAAGIMVVASAGNNGPSCSTVIDPIGIYDATFSVGAYDADYELNPSEFPLAAFSSRGPVTADGSGRLKPDLTAPGVGVLSTYPYSNTRELSGTSMASPHVVGAIALLWSAAPWLVGEIDLTEQVLLKSATPVYNSLCSGGNEPISPNPSFGYGRLNVAAAVEMALQPWDVTVAVTDSVGAPVVGAEILWIDARTGYTYTATTNISGTAVITPMLAGEYTLQVHNDESDVEEKDVALINEGTGNDPQTGYFAVVFEGAVIPLPEKIYLPGIVTE